MKKFTIELTLTVPETWIRDGFNIDEWKEEIEKHVPTTLLSVLPSDFKNELKVSTKIKTNRKATRNFKVKKIRLYTFNQLSKAAKEKALFEQEFCNVENEWWESTYEDAKHVGLTLTGFDLDRANYCHGYLKHGAIETADKILVEHGKDCETFKTATKFLADRDALVKKYSNGTDRVTEENEYEFDNDCDALEKDFLHDILEDYRIILQKEHDYLTSEEQIIEHIKANNWTFTAEGKLQN